MIHEVQVPMSSQEAAEWHRAKAQRFIRKAENHLEKALSREPFSIGYSLNDESYRNLVEAQDLIEHALHAIKSAENYKSEAAECDPCS